MKYRLTHKDDRQLWMIASPREIREEFGERSHSTRHIYRVYQKYGLSGIKAHRRTLRGNIREKSGNTLSEEYITKKMDEHQMIEREAAFIEMWKKIREFEERF